MIKKVIFIGAGFLVGILIGLGFMILNSNSANGRKELLPLPKGIDFSKKEIIGFLPYWLLSKAQNDYSKYITTLTYFGLTLDTDGTILKKTNPQEADPGYHALFTGKADPFLKTAKDKGNTLSLLVFAAKEDTISTLMEDPIAHAKNLIEEVKPIMREHNFKDLNLDIESVKIASDEARLHFTQFVQQVKKGVDENHLGTLTIDVAPDGLIKKYLVDLPAIAGSVDQVVIMAYDFHYIGSMVTGPVAPFAGAGTESEFDTQVAIQEALKSVPAKKIVLGAPLYGYGWETIRDATRSATIPSSGVTSTTRSVEQLIQKCATCSAQTDQVAGEQYLVYKDTETGTFHQIFYPNAQSMQAKIDYVKQEKLAGLALWALGYEDPSILEPLQRYKSIIKF